MSLGDHSSFDLCKIKNPICTSTSSSYTSYSIFKPNTTPDFPKEIKSYNYKVVLVNQYSLAAATTVCEVFAITPKGIVICDNGCISTKAYETFFRNHLGRITMQMARICCNKTTNLIGFREITCWRLLSEVLCYRLRTWNKNSKGYCYSRITLHATIKNNCLLQNSDLI